MMDVLEILSVMTSDREIVGINFVTNDIYKSMTESQTLVSGMVHIGSLFLIPPPETVTNYTKILNFP